MEKQNVNSKKNVRSRPLIPGRSLVSEIEVSLVYSYRTAGIQEKPLLKTTTKGKNRKECMDYNKSACSSDLQRKL